MTPYRDTLHALASLYPQGEAAALARMVFEERFGMSQTDLLLGKDSNLSANDRTELHNIVVRLLKNEPIQYVLGQTVFCGLTIGVGPGVLIPRPETAELVEWVAAQYAGLLPESSGSALRCSSLPPPRVLDIGTGSGCIALALASRGFRVEAWDVSEEALTIARGNAERLGLDVLFERKDILQIGAVESRYDLIVSNPPYVCQREALDMERNVLDHEPSLALFVPDDDPLLFYRTIARFARTALVPGGQLFFEINRAYGPETAEILRQQGFCDVEVRQDQFGNDRMARGTRVKS